MRKPERSHEEQWCGVTRRTDVSLQKRIIGGQNCDEGERLYHVRLESSYGNEKIRCGGSLIHPQWILTAAHCWKAETTVATLNVHPRAVRKQIRVIKYAPQMFTLLGQLHDIMLLKLETPVGNVPLAQLPDCSYRLQVGHVVQLAGEGATITGPNNQRCERNIEVMRIKSLFLSLQRRLREEQKTFLFYNIHKYINKIFLQGDDGGAVVYNGMIYGVISFGVAYYACQSHATVTDVCEYLGWIKSTAGLI
uniref:Peptidase S1 domain-containing protein n=1 Tax=Xiphophorus couchianus TaxID=32473 RepID=A0A3B5KYK9_9TELE